jgi:hypothetical protein
MPIGTKTALDEIIAERNAKQAKKSVKQLYLERSGDLNPKVLRVLCCVLLSGADLRHESM